MFDLENLGQTFFLHDLSYLRLQTWYEVDLSVDFNIFKIEDIKNNKNKHVTLLVDLETQGHTLFSYDLAYLRLYACYLLDLGVESNILKVEDLRKLKINHLTLMFDLENLGQTFFCMTFHISGCKHDTKSILVSILTFSRSKISKIIKTNTWPYWLTLKLKVIHFFHMTLLISGCMPCYLLDLGVESNILKVEDLRKFISGYLTLMFDLDFQGQTTFLQIHIIFKVSHYRYIIYFWFFEFFDLDYVKINTEIKAAACIQPEIMKVIWKYVWPWFSRSTMKFRWHMLVILRFQTSDMFKSTPNIVSLSRIQPMMNKGSQ